MLGSITPLGERGRRSRWAVTMTAFVAGSVAGGAAFGAALGWLGALGRAAFGWTPGGRLLALGVAVLVGAVFDLRLLGATLPTVHRQVDERWLDRYRGWVYGVGFGVQLGLGVVTIVVTAAIYATFAAAFLSGSAARGALIGGAFGLFRAATSFSVARVRSPGQLALVDARLRRLDRPSRRATTALEVAIAAAAVAAVLL
jgi:hypothetical protein